MVKWRRKGEKLVVQNDNEVENKGMPGKLLTKKTLNMNHEKKRKWRKIWSVKCRSRNCNGDREEPNKLEYEKRKENGTRWRTWDRLEDRERGKSNRRIE